MISCVVFGGYACNTNPSMSHASARGENGATQAVLHAIIVADTENLGAAWLGVEKLEIGTKSDLTKINKLVTNIASASDMRLDLHIVKGQDFSDKYVRNIINQLNIIRNDVILFYYSGHGTNRKYSSDSWPNLVLGENQDNQTPLDEIVFNIREKNARFYVVLVDACNNFDESFATRGMEGPLELTSFNKEGYRKLFSIRGSVIGIASKGGERAFGDSKGGRFTEHMLRELNSEAESSTPNWHEFQKKAKLPVKYDKGNGILTTQEPVQNPIIEVSINEVPVPTIPNPLKISISILSGTRPSVGSPIEVLFSNESNAPGYLYAWDIDSRGKVALIVEEVKFEPADTKTSTSKAIEPIGKSFLIGVLSPYRNLEVTGINRQQLEEQLRWNKLEPTVIEYEVIR